MVIWWWLDVEVLVCLWQSMQAVVTECRESVRQDAILIVLSDTS